MSARNLFIEEEINLPENRHRSKTLLPNNRRNNSLSEEKKLKITSSEMFKNYYNKIDEYIKFIDEIMLSLPNVYQKDDYISLKENIFSEKNYLNELFKVLKIKETDFNEFAQQDKQFLMTNEEEKMLFGELNTHNQTLDLTDLAVLNK